MFQTLNYVLLFVVAVLVYFETLLNKKMGSQGHRSATGAVRLGERIWIGGKHFLFRILKSLRSRPQSSQARWPDLQATATSADSLDFVLHGIASCSVVAALQRSVALRC